LGGSQVYVNEISFYFNDILREGRTMIQNFSVLYKFSSEGFVFPNATTSSVESDYDNAGIPRCDFTNTRPTAVCFNAEWAMFEAGFVPLTQGVFNVPNQSG
jgi:hypothetical protein